MKAVNHEKLVAAMKDLGIEKLPIRKLSFDQNMTLANPFTTCMSAVEQAIDEVMTAHASWKSKTAAAAALLEIEGPALP